MVVAGADHGPEALATVGDVVHVHVKDEARVGSDDAQGALTAQREDGPVAFDHRRPGDGDLAPPAVLSASAGGDDDGVLTDECRLSCRGPTLSVATSGLRRTACSGTSPRVTVSGHGATVADAAWFRACTGAE